MPCGAAGTRAQVATPTCGIHPVPNKTPFHILRVARKSIKWTWAEPFEMNVKIEQELNFVVGDSRLFLDAQEAKKVSEHTLV